MSDLFSDTRPEAEDVYVRLLRETPSWRKLELVDQLNQSVKIFVLAGLKQSYPDASDAQLQRSLAELLLGEELADKAYGVLHKES